MKLDKWCKMSEYTQKSFLFFLFLFYISDYQDDYHKT